MVTKNNIKNVIDSYLKTLKVRFNSTDEYFGCRYEIFVSSISSYIQVEYDLENDDDNEIIIQFFTEMYDSVNSLYHQIWDSTNNNSSVEDEIFELIEVTKRLNKAISKISKNIDNIKEICEDYGIEFDNFINLKYDFN